MNTAMNNIFKNLLCLMIAVLLSLTELQFFQGAEIFSVIFLLILAVTVPTVYLYFLPKQDTVLIFIFNIILVYILDVLGKTVNVKLLLASLFCVCLLLFQSVFTENAKRFKSKQVPYRAYCLILILFLSAAVMASYSIYEYILKPSMDDKVLYIGGTAEEQVESEHNNANVNQEKNKDGGGGGPEEAKPKINVLRLIAWIIACAIVSAILYLLYRLIRYEIWLRRTLRAPNNEKIRRLYIYILNSLALCGFPKDPWQTPIEYLALCNGDDFPFLKTEFRFLTATFISAYYSNRQVNEDECHRCVGFFRSASKYIRQSMGARGYLFGYLLKHKLQGL